MSVALYSEAVGESRERREEKEAVSGVAVVVDIFGGFLVWLVVMFCCGCGCGCGGGGGGGGLIDGFGMIVGLWGLITVWLICQVVVGWLR